MTLTDQQKERLMIDLTGKFNLNGDTCKEIADFVGDWLTDINVVQDRPMQDPSELDPYSPHAKWVSSSPFSTFQNKPK